MQPPYHQLAILTSVAVLSLSTGCFSHAGNSVDADRDAWLAHAERACHRGDRIAFETFVERAGVEQRYRCRERTVRQITTPIGAD